MLQVQLLGFTVQLEHGILSLVLVSTPRIPQMTNNLIQIEFSLIGQLKQIIIIDHNYPSWLLRITFQNDAYK